MNLKIEKRVNFHQFLEKFPVIDLPIRLGSDMHHAFSQKNVPLTILEIQQYIEPIEESELDEFTEFVPCFSIPNAEGFYGIVYWKAGLMNYQYRLVTFSKKGILLYHKVIAGTFSSGKSIVQSVATIDSDWSIHIVTGNTSVKGEVYDASQSKVLELELYPDGFIEEDKE